MLDLVTLPYEAKPAGKVTAAESSDELVAGEVGVAS